MTHAHMVSTTSRLRAVRRVDVTVWGVRGWAVAQLDNVSVR